MPAPTGARSTTSPRSGSGRPTRAGTTGCAWSGSSTLPACSTRRSPAGWGYRADVGANALRGEPVLARDARVDVVRPRRIDARYDDLAALGVDRERLGARRLG